MGEKSLNQQIAELLGYSVKPTELPIIGYRWECVAPNGKPLYADTLAWSEDEAWEQNMPNFYSLDVIWDALADDPNASLTIDRMDGKPYALINFYGSDRPTFEANGEDVHEAAAKALLKWAQSQRKDNAHG